MTVKELIEELTKLPQDLVVAVEDSENGLYSPSPEVISHSYARWIDGVYKIEPDEKYVVI